MTTVDCLARVVLETLVVTTLRLPVTCVGVCRVSTEVASVEDVFGAELPTLGACRIVVSSGERVPWEPVQVRVGSLGEVKAVDVVMPMMVVV